MSNITEFYEGSQDIPGGVAGFGAPTDASGPGGRATIMFVLQEATNHWLEHRHNYIQWLFPIPEPSLAVPDSPMLTAEDIKAFKSDVGLRIRSFAALNRMVWFYASGNCSWVTPRNHNYLRITRIIRFFVLIGEQGLAGWFHRTMVQLGGGGIDETTLWYWDEALKQNPSWL